MVPTWYDIVREFRADRTLQALIDNIFIDLVQTICYAGTSAAAVAAARCCTTMTHVIRHYMHAPTQSSAAHFSGSQTAASHLASD